MAKDPAFLFYYQDFLVGTEFMKDAEIGRYIKILCHLADKGTLKLEQVESICGASGVTRNIMDKLLVDDCGNYYNKRLREVVEKRRKFTESRRKNAASVKHVPQHMENEIENENINANANESEKEILKPKEHIIKSKEDLIEHRKENCGY